MTMADYGTTVFESHDHDEAERVFNKLTRQHIGMAAIKAVAALRAQTPDRDAGERMREACAKVCEDRIEGLEALGSKRGTVKDCVIYELRAAAGLIRFLPLATERKR